MSAISYIWTEARVQSIWRIILWKYVFFSHGSGTNQDGATLSMLNVMAELANRDHEVIGIMAKDVNLEYMKKKKMWNFILFHHMIWGWIWVEQDEK